MLVDDIRRTSGVVPEKKKKKKKKETTTAFSEILDVAEETTAKKDVEKFLEDVDRADQALREQPNFNNLEEYKKTVKNFLENVVSKYIKIKKRTGRLGTRTKVYMILEKVDNVIDEIEEEMKKSLDFDIAGKLDEIRGILIDVYS